MFNDIDIYYILTLHSNFLRRNCITLNEIWGERKLKGLPDHFTAILQLALGLEYLHSQKLIHREIKPENVVIWNGDTGITMKWAYYESPLHYDKSKKIYIEKQTNIKEVSDRIDQLTLRGEELESETNIEKTTGSTFSIEHEKNPTKITDQSHIITQKLQEKGESKINIEKGTEQMSGIEKELLENETIFFTSKRSRTWQAPELQTLSNPQYLATFESDVFAAGLVFGSLLLNGAHPFGVDEDKIISNIKMNEPVNVKSKSLLIQDFFSYVRVSILTFYHVYLFIH
jgi:serine/threonine protein kinase